ncbi:MAG: GNAT family N-acetyltransferase, partial [Pseudomonadota bacterium]
MGDEDAAVVTVRPLAAADETAWRRLWSGYLAFYETALPDEMVDLAFQRLLSDAPNEFQGRLALRGGEAVGLAHFLFHRHGWRVEPVVYLQDLFVDPAHRGAGAGRAFFEAVSAVGYRGGAGFVYCITQYFTAPARRLYDRVG